ncbi:MAG: FHA domain-containing protein [Candidatus Saccharimonas sp.]
MPRHDIPNPERIRPSQGEVTANGLSMDKMKPQQAYSFDGEQQLYPPEQVGLPAYEAGFRLQVMTELAAPTSGDDSLHAVVVQYVRNDGHKYYRIVGLEAPKPGELQRVLPATKLHPGLTLTDGECTIGREDADDGSMTPAQAIWGRDTVAIAEKLSRRHLEVSVREGVVSLKDTSKNGTYMPKDAVINEVETQHNESRRLEVLRSYTRLGSEKARNHGELVDGKYQGRRRPLEPLSRDKPVYDGSVDLRTYGVGGEVITIDSKDPEYQREYTRLRQEFINRWRQVYEEKGRFDDDDAVIAVKEAVREVMNYSLDGVKRVANAVHLATGSRDVNIAEFIRGGVGICRHMGLAAAWLMNEAVAMHALPSRGLGYSEANSVPDLDAGHEWARYVNEQGEVFIIDPAFDFAGRLADVPGLEEDMRPLWEEYFRSDEERRYYMELYESRKNRGLAPKLGRLAKIAWNFLR